MASKDNSYVILEEKLGIKRGSNEVKMLNDHLFYFQDAIYSSKDYGYDSDHSGDFSDKDLYLFDGIEGLPKQLWLALTDRYLSVGSNNIEWIILYNQELMAE